jgi:hypothetical protein
MTLRILAAVLWLVAVLMIMSGAFEFIMGIPPTTIELFSITTLSIIIVWIMENV